MTRLDGQSRPLPLSRRLLSMALLLSFLISEVMTVHAATAGSHPAAVDDTCSHRKNDADGTTKEETGDLTAASSSCAQSPSPASASDQWKRCAGATPAAESTTRHTITETVAEMVIDRAGGGSSSSSTKHASCSAGGAASTGEEDRVRSQRGLRSEMIEHVNEAHYPTLRELLWDLKLARMAELRSVAAQTAAYRQWRLRLRQRRARRCRRRQKQQLQRQASEDASGGESQQEEDNEDEDTAPPNVSRPTLGWVDCLHLIPIFPIGEAVRHLQHERDDDTLLALFYAPSMFPQYNYAQWLELFVKTAVALEVVHHVHVPPRDADDGDDGDSEDVSEKHGATSSTGAERKTSRDKGSNDRTTRTSVGGNGRGSGDGRYHHYCPLLNGEANIRHFASLLTDEQRELMRQQRVRIAIIDAFYPERSFTAMNFTWTGLDSYHSSYDLDGPVVETASHGCTERTLCSSGGGDLPAFGTPPQLRRGAGQYAAPQGTAAETSSSSARIETVENVIDDESMCAALDPSHGSAADGKTAAATRGNDDDLGTYHGCAAVAYAHAPFARRGIERRHGTECEVPQGKLWHAEGNKGGRGGRKSGKDKAASSDSTAASAQAAAAAAQGRKPRREAAGGGHEGSRAISAAYTGDVGSDYGEMADSDEDENGEKESDVAAAKRSPGYIDDRLQRLNRVFTEQRDAMIRVLAREGTLIWPPGMDAETKPSWLMRNRRWPHRDSTADSGGSDVDGSEFSQPAESHCALDDFDISHSPINYRRHLVRDHHRERPPHVGCDDYGEHGNRYDEHDPGRALKEREERSTVTGTFSRGSVTLEDAHASSESFAQGHWRGRRQARAGGDSSCDAMEPLPRQPADRAVPGTSDTSAGARVDDDREADVDDDGDGNENDSALGGALDVCASWRQRISPREHSSKTETSGGSDDGDPDESDDDIMMGSLDDPADPNAIASQAEAVAVDREILRARMQPYVEQVQLAQQQIFEVLLEQDESMMAPLSTFTPAATIAALERMYAQLRAAEARTAAKVFSAAQMQKYRLHRNVTSELQEACSSDYRVDVRLAGESGRISSTPLSEHSPPPPPPSTAAQCTQSSSSSPSSTAAAAAAALAVLRAEELQSAVESPAHGAGGGVDGLSAGEGMAGHKGGSEAAPRSPVLPAGVPAAVLHYSLPFAGVGSSGGVVDARAADPLASSRFLLRQRPPALLFPRLQGSRPYFFPQSLMRLVRQCRFLGTPAPTRPSSACPATGEAPTGHDADKNNPGDHGTQAGDDGFLSAALSSGPDLSHYPYRTRSTEDNPFTRVAVHVLHLDTVIEGPTATTSVLRVLLEAAEEAAQPGELEKRLHREQLYIWERQLWEEGRARRAQGRRELLTSDFELRTLTESPQWRGLENGGSASAGEHSEIMLKELRRHLQVAQGKDASGDDDSSATAALAMGSHNSGGRGHAGASSGGDRGDAGTGEDTDEDSSEGEDILDDIAEGDECSLGLERQVALKVSRAVPADSASSLSASAWDDATAAAASSMRSRMGGTRTERRRARMRVNGASAPRDRVSTLIDEDMFFEYDGRIQLDPQRFAETAPLVLDFFLRTPTSVVEREMMGPLRAKTEAIRRRLQFMIVADALRYGNVTALLSPLAALTQKGSTALPLWHQPEDEAGRSAAGAGLGAFRNYLPSFLAKPHTQLWQQERQEQERDDREDATQRQSNSHDDDNGDAFTGGPAISWRHVLDKDATAAWNFLLHHRPRAPRTLFGLLPWNSQTVIHGRFVVLSTSELAERAANSRATGAHLSPHERPPPPTADELGALRHALLARDASRAFGAGDRSCDNHSRSSTHKHRHSGSEHCHPSSPPSPQALSNAALPLTAEEFAIEQALPLRTRVRLMVMHLFFNESAEAHYRTLPMNVQRATLLARLRHTIELAREARLVLLRATEEDRHAFCVGRLMREGVHRHRVLQELKFFHATDQLHTTMSAATAKATAGAAAANAAAAFSSANETLGGGVAEATAAAPTTSSSSPFSRPQTVSTGAAATLAPGSTTASRADNTASAEATATTTAAAATGSRSSARSLPSSPSLLSKLPVLNSLAVAADPSLIARAPFVADLPPTPRPAEHKQSAAAAAMAALATEQVLRQMEAMEGGAVEDRGSAWVNHKYPLSRATAFIPSESIYPSMTGDEEDAPGQKGNGVVSDSHMGAFGVPGAHSRSGEATPNAEADVRETAGDESASIGDSKRKSCGAASAEAAAGDSSGNLHPTASGAPRAPQAPQPPVPPIFSPAQPPTTRDDSGLWGDSAHAREVRARLRVHQRRIREERRRAAATADQRDRHIEQGSSDNRRASAHGASDGD